MNFFSSDEYLDALGTVWFSGRVREPRTFAVGGRLFRLLHVHGVGAVVTDGLRPDAYGYLDYFEPLAECAVADVPAEVRWLPRAALGTSGDRRLV